MGKRKSGQKTHDRKVKQLARDLKKQGFNVKAHVGGYDTPNAIGKGGHIPDIYAKKGSKEKIIEVDTPGTEDPTQLSTFRRSAAHRKNAEFQHVITKPKKKK
jgi:hypothetical protein